MLDAQSIALLYAPPMTDKIPIKRVSEAVFVKNHSAHIKFVETEVKPITITARGKPTTYLIPAQHFREYMRVKEAVGAGRKRRKRQA